MKDPILAAYRARKERKHVKPATLLNTDKHLRRYQAFLDGAGHTAASIPPLLVEEHFSDYATRLAPTTLGIYLVQVKAAYRYALRTGAIAKLPTEDVELPPVPDVEPATFTAEQLRAIWRVTRNQRDRVLFIGLAYTGLRISELLQLRRQDVDLEHRQMKVTGKGDKFRLVPVHPIWAEALVQAQRRGDYVLTTERNFGNRPITYRHSQDHLKRLLRLAGVDGSAHVFRKTVATVLDEEDVRESVIDAIMGWAPRTVRRRHYTRVASDRLFHGILALYRSDPVISEDAESRAIWRREIGVRQQMG